MTKPTMAGYDVSVCYAFDDRTRSPVFGPRKAKIMTVADLIKALESLPPDAPVALRTVLPDQRIRWDDIESIELRAPDDLPPVVLIR